MLQFKFIDIICVGYIPEILDANFTVDTDYTETILQSDAKCILLSFKFNKQASIAGINLAINSLEFLRQRSQKSIGFCDYSSETLELILKTKKLENLSLFENLNVPRLLYYTKGKRVIAYCKCKHQKRNLFQKLTKYSNFAKIVGDKEKFKNTKDKYDVAITEKTIIKSGKPSKLYAKDGAIVYDLSGLIDTAFINEFNEDELKLLLNTGFSHFAFSLGSAPAISAHATEFLEKISDIAKGHNATISVCGVESKHISEKVDQILKNANINLYSSLDEYFKNINTKQTNALQTNFAPRHVTKQIMSLVRQIASQTISGLDFIYDTPVIYADVAIKHYEPLKTDHTAISVMFFGDVTFRMVLSLENQLCTKLTHLFFDNDEDIELAFYGLLNIISSRIISFFETKNIKLKTSIPKFYKNETFGDTKSAGASVNFQINKLKGSLFISA